LKQNKPALFISALEPGHTGGGALCTLAYLQALSLIHKNGLIYLGPKFGSTCYIPGKLKKTIFTPKRRTLSKIITLLQLRSADRLSPFVENTVKTIDDDFEIAYINDERAGRFAAFTNFMKKKTITIFHNYRAEYQKYNKNGYDLLKKIANYINVKNSLLGYKYSDYRIFLTEHDRDRYHVLFKDNQLLINSSANDYFGTCSEDEILQRRPDNGFNITINASLGRGHNVNSILIFIKVTWPRIIKKDNRVQLIIAGRNPVRALESAVQKAENVTILPNPTVPEMDNIFSKTAVSVCTNTEGSGIKLRVAEALRRGIPVVCSKHSSIGYENIDPKVLRVYSTSEECASHIISLIGNNNYREISEKCFKEFSEKLSFEIGVKKLTKKLREHNIL